MENVGECEVMLVTIGTHDMRSGARFLRRWGLEPELCQVLEKGDVPRDVPRFMDELDVS